MCTAGSPGARKRRYFRKSFTESLANHGIRLFGKLLTVDEESRHVIHSTRISRLIKRDDVLGESLFFDCLQHFRDIVYNSICEIGEHERIIDFQTLCPVSVVQTLDKGVGDIQALGFRELGSLMRVM